MPQTYRAVSVISDADGRSDLRDVIVPLESLSGGIMSAFTPAAACVVIHGEPDSFKDWHTGGSVAISVVLEGTWEIEAGTGRRRVLERGDLLFVLDVDGQGHRSRTLGDVPVRVLGVTFECSPEELLAHFKGVYR